MARFTPRGADGVVCGAVRCASREAAVFRACAFVDLRGAGVGRLFERLGVCRAPKSALYQPLSMNLPCALNRGALADVVACLEHGADPNAVHPPGYSALHVAVERGDAASAEVLLRRGAVVNARDRYGGTPLHRAVRFGRSECCRSLLSAGADVELANEYGWTPLYQAVCCRSLDCAAQLLAAGASGCAEAHNGCTPIELLGLRCWPPMVAVFADAAAAAARWRGLRQAALTAWCSPR